MNNSLVNEEILELILFECAIAIFIYLHTSLTYVYYN